MEYNNDSQELSTAGIIRGARMRKYRTAKDFWTEHQKEIEVSYPHYSSIENGNKFPDIKLTIRIAEILKINLKLACHVWARDQMPDPATRAFFEPLAGAEIRGVPAAHHHDLDNFYILTENQIPDLKAMPYAWDVLMLIMAFSESTPVSETEILNALECSPEELKRSIEWLRNEGMVISKNGKYMTKRRFFHIPNTEPFKALRDNNFYRTSQNLLNTITTEQLVSRTAFRITYMRRITAQQAVQIAEHIDSLIGHFGNMDDLGTELYALTIAFGVRATVRAQK